VSHGLSRSGPPKRPIPSSPPIARPAQVHPTAAQRAAGPRSRATRRVSAALIDRSLRARGLTPPKRSGPADVTIAVTRDAPGSAWQGTPLQVQAANRPDPSRQATPEKTRRPVAPEGAAD
jgi:hypothetical protein